MYATELTIGEHVFRLPDGVDEDEVLAQLTDAIRAGGGIVDLPGTSTHSAKAVLVSPGVAVFIERIIIPDEELLGPEGDGDGDPISQTDWPI